MNLFYECIKTAILVDFEHNLLVFIGFGDSLLWDFLFHYKFLTDA